MSHSRFEKPKVVPIAGVRYVLTVFAVVETFEDGQPKTISVVRDGSQPDPMLLVYAPEAWSRP